ncbi:MAG: UvrD-helicase domain-containing protein [Desulfovibrio sp.]
MSRFIADLHIHSRFSRATSKKLTLRNLAAWARIKGIDVLGTGDFTHPGWLEEMDEQFVQQDNGLFALKDTEGLESEIPGLQSSLTGKTQFMLQTEISSIYKKNGKTRKVHNLVYMPNMDSVEKFNTKLREIGNLDSDGRPILGLDCHSLLDLVLSTHPKAFLIPAHIWTPWFSLFGDKSGFDSIEECYGDLSSEIFAMETGLSSDPDMNWMWSALDKIKLISNSDAHSGEKLGREANYFQGEMSYDGIYNALRGTGLGNKFLGTVEFFPEEGKYYMDGHRKCNIMLTPEETLSRNGVCPACGKPVTKGTLSRIMELADRDAPERPDGQPGFTSLVPLKEICSEILGVRPTTKKVANFYAGLIADFGSEFNILTSVPADELKRHSPYLAEGIHRMRAGTVIRNPGFDGQYGAISVFTKQEQASIKGGLLIQVAENTCMQTGEDSETNPAPCNTQSSSISTPDDEDLMDIVYNDQQIKALEHAPGPILVMAGPGTGKTQTLLGRINFLMDREVSADKILALTFTRRAAGELGLRLFNERGENADLPQTDTIHALAFEYWSYVYDGDPIILSEEAARRVFAENNPQLSGTAMNQSWHALQLARETMTPLSDELMECALNYSNQKDSWNLVDYTDLLEFYLEQSGSETFPEPYEHVLVDEIQDLSPLQLAVIRALTSKNGDGFFGIGDVKQSIYGFRGAHGNVEQYLKKIWPTLTSVTLDENYRSGQKILNVSAALFEDELALKAMSDIPASVHRFSAPDAIREAGWIADKIKKLIGATSHSLADVQEETNYSPGDLAVLVRFKALIPPIVSTLRKHGIPCAIPEVEAFWKEPRVEAILGSAGLFLGISMDASHDPLNVPDKILAKGPIALSAYLGDMPPFDQLFWESNAYRQLKRAFDDHGGWAGLLNWINLQTELEQVKAKAEQVQIMTMHASKGLEFKGVFLPALEDGIMPFAGLDILTGKRGAEEHWQTTKAESAEERRLLYVGMTRAKEQLFLSHSAKRAIYGRSLNLSASRFLEELPAHHITRTALKARKVQKTKQMSLI